MSYYASLLKRVIPVFRPVLKDVVIYNKFREFPCARFIYGGCAFFAVLLSLKTLYDFFLTLFVPLIICICLYGVFVHADRVIVDQVIASRKEKLQRSVLVKELFYVSFCVLIVHNLFGETMYNLSSIFSFIFLINLSNSVNFFEIVWMLITLDITFKLLAVYIKILIILVPVSYMEFDQRGVFYYFVEHTLILVKCILATQPWLYYFYYSYNGFETLLGLLMCVFYLAFKITGLKYTYSKIKISSYRLLELFQTTDFSAAMKDCPICFNKCIKPLTLKCKHTFCTKCFWSWYGRNDTCPVCRQRIEYPQNNYLYENGNTGYFIQIF